jgi:glycosyltransferase involved in cell wall biosynthesis
LKDISPDPGILDKTGLSKNSYLLGVASLSIHKNFGRLLQAIELVNPQVEFVAAGGNFDHIFQKTDLKPGHSKVRMLGYINDHESKALYENALGFVFPSLYEGFGLPILEAMYCGCPVVCSKAASIPEVGGTASDYFNPREVIDMAAVIKQFLADPEIRSTLRDRGYKQARCFLWEKTARMTLAQLLECL